ncbi:radical SAM protein [Candidatus Woesearchaeota archaeon]|nr:radical SAM protein [Candidatus Woesearchaeota archaeon]
MKLADLFPPTIDGSVYLEITHRCNYNCKHCYVRSPQNREMPLERAIQIIDILKQNKFRKIIITGGEPLLHPNIKEIIEYVKKNGFKLVLITNGTLVKETNIDYSLLDAAYVSFDGSTEEEYRLLRGKEGLAKAEEAIKYLASIGVKVSIGCILSKFNVNKINELIKKLNTLPADKITVTIPQPFGRTLENKEIMLSPEEYNQCIPILAQAENIHFESMLCYPMELRNESEEISNAPLFEKYMSGCAAGKKFIYISPEGFVTPCGYVTADKNFMELTANITEKSLEEVYDTELFQFYMNRSWESVTGKCTKCDYNIVCKGGCPLRSHYLKGNAKLPDPWCSNEPIKNQYVQISNVKLKNFVKIEKVVEVC